jgi:hypothetical protein
MSLPDKTHQIIVTYAAFIRQFVECTSTAGRKEDAETLLRVAETAGWTALVVVLRQILKGRRDAQLLVGLDQEDSTIAKAILDGLQDPSTLPDPGRGADPALAAPGLAHMIQAAATGNVQALALVGNMAEQMRKVGGEMAQLAGRIRPLINGERNPERLCKGMSARGEQLMLGILDQLGKLDLH